MRFYEFKPNIFEGYREAELEFSQVAEPDNVKQTILNYKNLVNKNQFQGQERNIDYWRKLGWEQFFQKVNILSSKSTKTQTKRRQIVGKSIFVDESPAWLIAVPLDKQASCFHGKKTDWCTAVPTADYFEDYFYNRNVLLIYCIKKETGEKFAIAAHKDLKEIEMFSADDTSISREKFMQDTGLDPFVIRDKAFNVAGIDVDKSRAEYKKILEKLSSLMYYNKGLSKRSQEIEDLLLYTRNQKFSQMYLEKVGKENYPPEIIMTAIRVTNSPSSDAKYFHYQENPSPALIKSSVRINPAVSIYIDNLDPVLQTQIVDHNPENIMYINNPGIDVQMKAISDQPELVEYIKNLDSRVALEAIKSDSSLIRLLHNPSEDLQLVAVEDNGRNIQYIDNPTPRVLIAAIIENPHQMKYIKNNYSLNPDILEQMVKASPRVIEHIDNPSKELQLLAVSNEPTTIFHIPVKDIDLEVWHEAVHRLDDYEIQRAVYRMPTEFIWKIFGNYWTKHINKSRSGSFYLSSEEANIIDLGRIFLKKLKTSESDRSSNISSETLDGAEMIRDFLKKVS